MSSSPVLGAGLALLPPTWKLHDLMTGSLSMSGLRHPRGVFLARHGSLQRVMESDVWMRRSVTYFRRTDDFPSMRYLSPESILHTVNLDAGLPSQFGTSPPVFSVRDHSA